MQEFQRLKSQMAKGTGPFASRKKNDQIDQSIMRVLKNVKNGGARRGPPNEGTSKMGVSVAYAGPTATRAPRISSNVRGQRIVHRELVTTIVGSTTFSCLAIALNPGLAAAFPWLSTVASSFEQYAFRKLRFHFVTRESTTYLGSLLLAPDYNAQALAPTTEVQASQMRGAVEDVPWRDQFLSFSVQDMHALGPRKFVRTGPAAGDLKTYDVGQLFACSIGCTDSTSNIGKLWVEYDVELFIPQNPAQPSLILLGSGSVLNKRFAEAQLVASTPQQIVWLNDTVLVDTIGIFGGVISGTFTLPVGSYKIEANVGFASTDNETTGGSYFLNLYVNGTKVTAPATIQSNTALAYVVPGATTSGLQTVYLQSAVVSNGTTTFAIYAEYIRDTGVVTIPAGTSQLSVMRIG
jgi:hypothetical protein